ncbi:hypothetical protein [Rhodopseudomonas palustris]|uniref:Uncharacterized protein n=1 Tax=Rhodopseudomonas palustris TaxID=1076 RepID=A0A418VH50_RHOPL|nr:hypothetical protein [Rhodopseudomonas palustris]RJF75460.1 hypothetical protein D4Q52_09785 [Rhodopseudomonas palustris]
MTGGIFRGRGASQTTGAEEYQRLAKAAMEEQSAEIAELNHEISGLNDHIALLSNELKRHGIAPAVRLEAPVRE